MNSYQQRALWAHALRELADMIHAGQAPVPTSMQLMSQWVTPLELLTIADHTTPEPLQINDYGPYVSVTVPVGRPLDLDITWVSQVHVPSLPADEQADFREAVRQHNIVCVGAPAAGPDDDDADPLADEPAATIGGQTYEERQAEETAYADHDL